MPVARPAIVNRLHHTPWPSWVAIGPGQASETPQPMPNRTLPTSVSRLGRAVFQAIGLGLTTARTRAARSTRRPTKAVTTAEPKNRNRYAFSKRRASRMTSGELIPVHDSVTPKIRPTRAPVRRAPIHNTASIAKLTAIAVAKKVHVATTLAGEVIAVPERPLPAVHPPAVRAPKAIRTPETTSRTAATARPAPWKVSVIQP